MWLLVFLFNLYLLYFWPFSHGFLLYFRLFFTYTALPHSSDSSSHTGEGAEGAPAPPRRRARLQKLIMILLMPRGGLVGLAGLGRAWRGHGRRGVMGWLSPRDDCEKPPLCEEKFMRITSVLFYVTSFPTSLRRPPRHPLSAHPPSHPPTHRPPSNLPTHLLPAYQPTHLTTHTPIHTDSQPASRPPINSPTHHPPTTHLATNPLPPIAHLSSPVNHPRVSLG